MKKIRVLGISGTVRSNEGYTAQVERFVAEAQNTDELSGRIKDFPAPFANTDDAVTDYVLGEFDSHQKKGLDEFVEKAANCLDNFLEEGINKAMSNYNRRMKDE